MIAFVWSTLRGTLASVHDIYAIFLNDEPVAYDSICLAHFAGHTGFGAWHTHIVLRHILFEIRLWLGDGFTQKREQ